LEWWAEALAAQWRLFLPMPQGDAGRWLGAVLLLALPILALRLVRARRDAEALAPLIILLAFGAIAVAAALERYPFGGKMRHQGLLLPLVWLSVAVAVSRWARPSSRLGRGLLLLGIVGCVGWQASRWGEAPGPDEFHRELMWSNDRDVWVATAGADDPLMTDAFSHVGCWAWSKSEGQRWRHRGSVGPGGVSWDLFDVDGGGLTRRVARLTSTWKWGRGDAIATALQADAMVAPRGPWDRVWLYVRDPQRTDGGGAADIEARQSLDLALASLGLRIVADVPRPASRLWGIGR
jgi:hypothetical protein